MQDVACGLDRLGPSLRTTGARTSSSNAPRTSSNTRQMALKSPLSRGRRRARRCSGRPSVVSTVRTTVFERNRLLSEPLKTPRNDDPRERYPSTNAPKPTPSSTNGENAILARMLRKRQCSKNDALEHARSQDDAASAGILRGQRPRHWPSS